MSAAQLHLAFSHLPVFGLAVAAAVLGYGLTRKEQLVISLALGLIVLLSLTVIPVYLSGDPAEEIVEHLPGVSEEVVEAHEEFAVVGLVCVLASGAFGFVALLFRSKILLARLSLVAVMLSVGALIWTAKLGGEIRHPEVRQDFAAPAQTEDD